MQTVILGGQEYDVIPLNMGASKAWRKKFGKVVEPLIEAMSSGIDANTDFGELAQLISALRDTILYAPDLCAEAMFEYSQVLRADRVRIEADSTDAEAMEVFVEVLKMAYPFSALIKMVPSGRMLRGTSKK